MPTGFAATAAWIGANAGTIGAVATAATAATGVYAANQQKKAQQAQLNAIKAATPKQLTQADKPDAVEQEVKTADVSSIQARNAQLAAAAGQLSGNNSTLLTGASGVDSSTLNLGKSTLLGQ